MNLSNIASVAVILASILVAFASHIHISGTWEKVAKNKIEIAYTKHIIHDLQTKADKVQAECRAIIEGSE